MGPEVFELVGEKWAKQRKNAPVVSIQLKKPQTYQFLD